MTSPQQVVSLVGTMCVLLCLATSSATAQEATLRYGNPVPAKVQSLYDAGLQYLVRAQGADGQWNSSQGTGPGVDGLCCLALLSRGQDPNFGSYGPAIHRGLRRILRDVDLHTGMIARGSRGGGQGSMYHHGFATLALAEAYGAVDERLLWKDAERGSAPAIGQALELAVRAIVTSQNQNPYGAWRYGPEAKDADTSVSGAILVALLAARNAGIEVPDASIEKALKFYATITAPDGSVGYQSGNVGSSFGESQARSAICCLVYAVAKQRDAEPHQLTIDYLKERLTTVSPGWKHYTRYYVAQALFQGDFEAWNTWNAWNTEMVTEELGEDGSIGGDAYTTSMSLLSMALNYRFLPIYER